MAINLESVYGSQANAANGNYPQGSGKNDAVAGDQTGTPLDQQWFNDMWGFFNFLLNYAGITPSGTPDNAVTSQYLQALDVYINDEIDTAIANKIAAGDFDARINTKISDRLQVVGGVLKYDANNNGDLDS